MARGFEDLLNLTLHLTATLSLDMERIEADPIYRQCLSSAEEDPEGALQTYIEHYAIRESVFRDMPSTNGPGRYLNVRIESTSGIQRNQDAASS